MSAELRSKTFIIAEVGSCHEVNFECALRLVRSVRFAGADAIKFQFWSSAARLAARRGAAAYEPIYARYAMPVDWFPALARYCRDAGLAFLCSVYLPEDVAVVAPHVAALKVASFELRATDLLDAIRIAGVPYILSTGMATVDEVEGILAVAPAPTHLLHCVSAYPCPAHAANLRGMAALAPLGVPVGYSDHTANVATGALAVAAGAVALEVHVKDDLTRPENPDAATALSPPDFAEYVRRVREAEAMLGDGGKGPQDVEAAMAPYRVVS